MGKSNIQKLASGVLTSKKLEKKLEKLFKIFCSLKMAIFILSLLVIHLAAATVLESIYDTPTAQYWIYRSSAFYGVLIALGINIFCVAMSRLPWRPKHTPFLLAHLGILILLLGSWITDRAGIDGSMRLSESESSSIVELDQNSLVIAEKNHLYSIVIPWSPPGVNVGKINLEKMKLPPGFLPTPLVVDEYISRAEQKVSFVPQSEEVSSNPSYSSQPAIQIKLTGGPMNMNQKLWLWSGSSTWNDIAIGPARFLMNGEPFDNGFKGPQLSFKKLKNGDLQYSALSSSQQKVQKVLKENKIQGHVIQPGWKGNVEITLLNWISDAKIISEYVPARIQYGKQAPASAIHIVAPAGADVWLGLGEKAVLKVEGREIELGYYPKRVILPFSLQLNRFQIDYDPGTLQAASYSSFVNVVGEPVAPYSEGVQISMNEPFEHQNYTFYQASYEEGDGADQPRSSIFSVNRDPGRWWKYTGSFLLVLGSALLFAVKYRRSYQQKRSKGSFAL